MLVHALESLYFHEICVLVGLANSHGLSRPRSEKRSPLLWVHPDQSGPVDSLLEAILRADEIARSVPLAFRITRLPPPLQIVRNVRIITAFFSRSMEGREQEGNKCVSNEEVRQSENKVGDGLLSPTKLVLTNKVGDACIWTIFGTSSP